MLWRSVLDATQNASKIEREADMIATEGNRSYNENRCLKSDPPPTKSMYHSFMEVLTDYTILTLTMWVEQFDH